MSIAYYNGDFSDFSSVRIPLSDRSIFFGDGIYDAAVGRFGNIYLEKEHLDRFFSNAKKLNIPIKLTRGELSEILRELIKRNGYEEYFIYIQLSRFSRERTHSYPDSENSNLLVTVKEHSLPPLSKELKLLTLPDVRYSMCNLKTLNLLPAVIASKTAEMQGCDEAVFIREGFVTECSHSNIHIIKNGILCTHPNGSFILPGITRSRLIDFCLMQGVAVKEIPFTASDLYNADEVLVTSTTRLCQKATVIDGKTVGNPHSTVGKKLILALREDFYKNVC